MLSHISPAEFQKAVHMKTHITDKVLDHQSLKMICIPRSNLNKVRNSGLQNEGYSTTEDGSTPGTNKGTPSSRKQYSCLVEDEFLPGESFPTAEPKFSDNNWCQVRRSTVLLHLYVPFYSLYLLVGAVLFSLIEGPIERDYIEELRDFRMKFLERNTCVSDYELEKLIVEILRANNRGVSAARNVTGEPNWSFGQSFFFSSTIVTTIGYGHVHPLSEGGKIFSIIYAIIGIPMTFILISALVERFLIPTTFILNYMNSRLKHLYESFNIRVLHLMFIGILLFLLFMVFPAMIFSKLEEDWNFLDAIYYCFISLTTIGLGDYIPGDAQDQLFRPIYKLCIAAYLILGLTAVMLLLHMYNDIPRLNLGLFLLRDSDEPQFSFQGQPGFFGKKYTQNDHDHPDKPIEQVKVVSRHVDAPAQEDDTMPVLLHVPPIISNNY